MTLKRFTAVSLLLAAGAVAYACGPWYFNASDNDIYRILPYGAEGHKVALSPDFSRTNILLWSRQTGCRDTAAIRKAIYGGTLKQWQELDFDSNSFVAKLVAAGDDDAIQLLRWSKLYECIRNAQRSPWYYSSGVTDEARQLRDLYDAVRKYRPARKYADRYAFLAIKCSWALGDDSATVAFWNKNKPRLRRSPFYAEAEDYAARSLYRMGRDDEAYSIYLRRGDLGSIMMLKQLRLPGLLDVALQAAPDSPALPVELQRMLFILENNYYGLNNTVCVEGYLDTVELLRVARRAAQTTIRSRRAMWCYTAACLLDIQRKPLEALRQLDGIDTLPCDAFLRKSIRVLRFYLRSKTDTISDNFERYALGELRWMDNELQAEWRQLPENERDALSKIYTPNPWWMYRSCYMYDAMRRILLPDHDGLCRRMALAGREVRALQLANMAENRLFVLSDNKIIKAERAGDHAGCYLLKDFAHDGFYVPWYSWLEASGSDGSYNYISDNGHDWCNGMFLLADRMNAATLERYLYRQMHHIDDIDCWLNARSYLDADYWHDIVGTHYLRECSYAAAAAHLKQVSPGFQRKMNISLCCRHNPFGYLSKIANSDSTGYKLHFAERMVSLERQMKSANPDSSALAMIEYSIGMRNSFGLCWPLTTYGQTSYEPDFENETWITLEEWQDDSYAIARLTALNYPYKKKYTQKAAMLQRKALATVKSLDAKAEAYARLGMFTKLMKECRNTSTAQYYALVCDEWKQYRKQ